MSFLDALIEDELWLPSPLRVEAGVYFPQREIWICRRTDGDNQAIFGSGTQDNPYDGTTHTKVDAVLSMLAGLPVNNLTIRFGPGVFETKGGGGNMHLFAGFQPNPGWRIVGSGMFQTTLKLVNAVGTNAGIPIFGNIDSDVDGFQASDLTLDCNIAGQPKSSGYDYPRLMVQGIAVNGTKIAIRRVRVINFGTQTPSTEYSPSGPVYPASQECFSIRIGGGKGNFIEDCIGEQSGTNNARGTTCIFLAAGESGVVRNCLVNGEVAVLDGGQPKSIANRVVIVKSVQYISAGGDHLCLVEFHEKHYKQVFDPNAATTTPSSFVFIAGIYVSPNGVNGWTTNTPYNGYYPVIGLFRIRSSNTK